jgi:hypothetical protein
LSPRRHGDWAGAGAAQAENVQGDTKFKAQSEHLVLLSWCQAQKEEREALRYAIRLAALRCDPAQGVTLLGERAR